MAEADQPQLYLVTPPEFDLSVFPDKLSSVLDAAEIACMRLSLATRDEDRLLRAADAVREVAHRYDIALVIDTHVVLAQRLGLDGVHLTDGSRSVRAARKDLGPDAIVGAFCASFRHDGMVAGEAGADYVSFGPLSGEALGDGTLADFEIFEWWSQMIEVPVVAEGGLTPELVAKLAPVTDFLSIGEEIWSAEDPAAALKTLIAAMH
ncbi:MULTISPECIES: thiamine phosphate synthase [unclassified Salipiger]|uniref:thiamine phosphate synthase n=1 Tax=unclassified Salipiger TaxID=2640570 RepID=UPI0013BC503E|nr:MULTISPECIES: thiamine phosphate synthase [unclassified Salipiger]NDV50889.1 thiamine phosphate synthase [Salipiger sp. PrR003]NDW34055.1 thiamine phosphate synthase [Salipiger sp. PrR007]